LHFFNLENVVAVASLLGSGVNLTVNCAKAAMLNMCPLDTRFRDFKVFEEAMQNFRANIWLFGGIFPFSYLK